LPVSLPVLGASASTLDTLVTDLIPWLVQENENGGRRANGPATDKGDSPVSTVEITPTQAARIDRAAREQADRAWDLLAAEGLLDARGGSEYARRIVELRGFFAEELRAIVGVAA
jgi:hypothetical protein